MPVTLRPISLSDPDSDLPFLRKLYASTRLEEVQQSGWPQDQINAFLLQQFEAQHTYYLEQFSSASFDIILNEDGTPIGRLYLDERDDEFRIIDISLLPSHRGKGIGSSLLQDIIAKATSSEKAIRIHVEHNNPAMQLYKRLGFKMLEDFGIHHLMELQPTSDT